MILHVLPSSFPGKVPHVHSARPVFVLFRRKIQGCSGTAAATTSSAIPASAAPTSTRGVGLGGDNALFRRCAVVGRGGSFRGNIGDGGRCDRILCLRTVL